MLSRIFISAYMKENLSSEGGPDRSLDPVLSVVQLTKTALYLDEIEEFGEWSILLSTRAQTDLRDIRRTDFGMFRIVMKKIK